MFVAVSIFPVIGFILIQIIFVNVGSVDSLSSLTNTTDEASLWKSVRSKRSIDSMPNNLKLRMKLETGSEITVNWIKKSQYIANKYLPIITTSGTEFPELMENIGEFVVYHDAEKCSSVVYYEKFNSFFGDLGMDYSITYLPYKLDGHGNYDGIAEAPFIMKRVTTLLHIPFSLPNTNTPPSIIDRLNGRAPKRPSDLEAGPSSKQQRLKRHFDLENDKEKVRTNESQINHIRTRRWNPLYEDYYLETLIFITRDVVEIFKKRYDADNYIAWIVRYCINHFNAADMIFKNLGTKNLKLLINIAKIVIEDDLAPFGFMNHDVIQSAHTMEQLRIYLHTHRYIFTQDSFDHVFMITSLPINDGTNFISGKTEFYDNMYAARKNDQFYEGVPITILNFVTDYVVAVQEISLTLNIKINPEIINNRRTGEVCSDIMQRGSSKCDNCLKWTYESKQQFIQFFSVNINRCFLLNNPRSLRPNGPSRYLTPHKQCQCFGYVGFRRNQRGDTQSIVRTHECDEPLSCEIYRQGQSIHEAALLPFDGTSCGSHQVCWESQCVHSRCWMPHNN